MSKWRTRTKGSSRQVGRRFRASSSRVKGGIRTHAYRPKETSFDELIEQRRQALENLGKQRPYEFSQTDLERFSRLRMSSADIEKVQKAQEEMRRPKPFSFEVTDYTYPTGFATVIGRMRLEKKYPDGSVEVWMIDVNRAPKDKMFYHTGRGIESIDQLAKPIFPYPTFQEFYEVSQSFHGPSTSSDPLGGFQSGLSGDVTDKGKLDTWLKEKETQGFRQVPYIKKR